MEVDKVLEQTRALKNQVHNLGDHDGAKLKGLKARAEDFLNTFGGKNNTFVKQIQSVSGSATSYQIDVLGEVLDAFSAHLEDGLVAGISPRRQAELDVVSDLLEQANILLSNAKVHPAAPAVLVGATLEEFLRTWIEEDGLTLGNKRPGIDAYAKVLREADLINKQDVKDITAWAGIRNHAAHGDWDEVADRSRIKLMLEGVNFLIKKKTA